MDPISSPPAPTAGTTDVASGKKPAAPALLRGAAILDLVASAPQGMTLSDIARALDLAKSTVHGLCETLCQLDLLRLEGRGYRMGAQALVWAQAFRSNSSVVEEFHRLIRLHPDLQHYTVSLSVLDRGDVAYLASHQTAQPLGMTFSPGTRLPAIYTATGKMILSRLPAPQLAEILNAPWPRALTPRSVDTKRALDDQLARWRAQGYAVDVEEVRIGMQCLGVAILDGQGAPLGGLALSMTLQEAQEASLPDLAKALQSVGDDLGRLF